MTRQRYLTRTVRRRTADMYEKATGGALLFTMTSQGWQFAKRHGQGLFRMT
jgi:hypothetical protein